MWHQLNQPSNPMLRLNQPSNPMLRLNQPSNPMLQLNLPSNPILQLNLPSNPMLQLNQPSNPMLRLNQPTVNLQQNNSIQWLEAALRQGVVKRFSYHQFTFVKKLGSGGFGDVYQAKWNNQTIAVKMLKDFHNNATLYNAYEDLVTELKFMLKTNNCQNILHFYGITKNPSSNAFYLVLEYADSGNLRRYLEKNFSKMRGRDKLRMAQEIANGIRSLHKHSIVHRDLHSGNILVHKGSIKITDFGIAKNLHDSTRS
ncbi:8434_t:CDS:2, partial [Racocetra persica]